MKGPPPSLRGVCIGIIGAGKMGQALIHGLLARGVARHALLAAEVDALRRHQVSRRYRIQTSGDPIDVTRQADVIILSVKPQQFPEVVARITPSVSSRHLVISIAAGITLRWLRARLPTGALVRIMPNLPATVGAGFSAVAWGRAVRPRHRAITLAIFQAVGEVVELPERSFDAITAVSGSGPAYLFFLVGAWEQGARALGLAPSVAARAVRRTLQGSLHLLEASGEDAAVLMQRVASKGGTTEAALKVLAKRRVAAAFTEALRAAAARSRQMRYQI